MFVGCIDAVEALVIGDEREDVLVVPGLDEGDDDLVPAATGTRGQASTFTLVIMRSARLDGMTS